MPDRLRPFAALCATLALCLGLGLGLASCGGDDDGGQETVLKVGIILPMTGQQATYGEESWNGLMMAEKDLAEGFGTIEVEEKNAAGKITKKQVPLKVTLIRRDEKSLKQEAGSHAKTLIDLDQVHVLLGTVGSSITKQIFQEARESEVPCISPASTNDTLTREGGPYTSRICFSDKFQASVLAGFARSKGWKKAAVVVDKAQDYSVGLANNFKTAFEAGGGSVSFQYYVTEDTDFSNVIENVAIVKPDVIFIAGYYGQAGPMIKQARGKWEGMAIIGGDGLDSPDFLKLLGDTNGEIYFSTHFAADAPGAQGQAFAKRYKKTYGKSPGAMAALGYDVLFVLADAVKRCKDPFDPEQLARAIRETHGLEGITGKISLDNEDRTPIKDAFIMKVDGAFAFHERIKANR